MSSRSVLSRALALLLLVAAARLARAAPAEIPPTTAVVFGATGDLARRKVFPALLSAWRSGALPAEVRIVAAARDGISREDFLLRLRAGMRSAAGIDVSGDAAWAELERRIEYVPVDLASRRSVRSLAQRLDDIDGASGRRRLLYLAVTPSVLEVAADHLGRAGLLSSHRGRGPPLVLVEKPFGRDATSARRLNRALGRHIPLGRVMRMDHYLGKPAIEDLRRLRASDPALARVWNRRFIRQVEISASEEIGIEGRGAFYEETGALRDVAQGHLLQALAVTAMEPPGGGSENAKSDVMGELRRLSPDRDVVRGQYEGYRDEPGVAPDSSVETYVAIRAHVDNPRWRGVPFLLESGKGLDAKRSAIRVHFRRLSPELARRFGVRADRPATLEVAIDPRPGISLTSGGRRVPVVESRPARPDAYERLLLAAMRGERALFVGGAEVERAWAWLDPVQKHWRRGSVAIYRRGIARPAAAASLFADKPPASRLPADWRASPSRDDGLTRRRSGWRRSRAGPAGRRPGRKTRGRGRGGAA